MKKLWLSLLLVSTAAFGQGGGQYLEYAEGEYSELPFNYPTILSEEEVTEIIRKLQNVTDDEINYIQHLPLPGLPATNNEIQIFVCKKGSRANGTCGSGDLYTFHKMNGGWERKGDGPGRWII